MPDTQYDGTPVFMAGQTWIVPGLSVKQFRKHFEVLTDTDINQGNVLAKIETRLPVILDAFNRNYPDVTTEQLEDMLDVGTFNQVMLAISSGSGLRPAKPGE
jgi:hypothetical protein